MSVTGTVSTGGASFVTASSTVTGTATVTSTLTTSAPAVLPQLSPAVKQGFQLASSVLGPLGYTVGTFASLPTSATASALEVANLYYGLGVGNAGFFANGGTGFSSTVQFGILGFGAGLGALALSATTAAAAGTATAPVVAALGATSAVGLGFSALGAASQFLAEDPPDPNFTSVVRFAPNPIGASQLGSAGQYAGVTANTLNALAAVQADELNILNDVQKFAGAKNAGDQFYQTLYSLAFQADTTSFSADLDELASTFAEFKSAIESDPQNNVPINLDAFAASLNELRTSLSQMTATEAIAVLAQLGLDPNLLTPGDILAVINSAPTPSVLNTDVFSILDQLSTEISSGSLNAFSGNTITIPAAVPEPPGILIFALGISVFVLRRVCKR